MGQFFILGDGVGDKRGVRLVEEVSTGDEKMEILSATLTKDILRLRGDGSGVGRTVLTPDEADRLGVPIDAAGKVVFT